MKLTYFCEVRFARNGQTCAILFERDASERFSLVVKLCEDQCERHQAVLVALFCLNYWECAILHPLEERMETH